jgi:hypothetical protein
MELNENKKNILQIFSGKARREQKGRSTLGLFLKYKTKSRKIYPSPSVLEKDV